MSLPIMLTGVDEVPWDDLGQAEVPERLRAIAEGSADKLTVWHLWGACFATIDSTEVQKIAVRLVPFLMELLAVPRIRRRSLILRLLGEVAAGTAADEGRGADHAQAARTRMADQIHSVIRLLDDPKDKVAIRAAYVLSRLPEAAEHSLEHLRAHAGKGSAQRRAAAVFAVGLLAAEDHVEWLRALLQPGDHPAVHAAAVAGLARAGAEVDDSMVRIAGYAIDGSEQALTRVRWNDDGIGLLGAALHASRPWHTALARHLLAGADPAGWHLTSAVRSWRSAAVELMPQLVDTAAALAPGKRDDLVRVIAQAGAISRAQADFLYEVADSGRDANAARPRLLLLPRGWPRWATNAPCPGSRRGFSTDAGTPPATLRRCRLWRCTRAA